VQPHDHGLEFYWDRQTEQEVQDLLQQHGLTPKKFILIHPPARWLFKCWTAEGYAQVIERCKTTITCRGSDRGPGPQERQFMLDIASRLQTNPVDLAGRLSLKALGAMIAQAGCLSAWIALPCTWPRPSDPHPSGPLRAIGTIQLRPGVKGISCLPRILTVNLAVKMAARYQDQRCLTAITPSEVLAAVDRQLQTCV